MLRPWDDIFRTSVDSNQTLSLWLWQITIPTACGLGKLLHGSKLRVITRIIDIMLMAKFSCVRSMHLYFAFNVFIHERFRRRQYGAFGYCSELGRCIILSHFPRHARIHSNLMIGRVSRKVQCASGSAAFHRSWCSIGRCGRMLTLERRGRCRADTTFRVHGAC